MGYEGPSVITQVVYISRTLTLRGGYTTTEWMPADPGVYPTTLDAGGQGRPLVIAGNIAPIIEGLRLTGGDAANLGGRMRMGGIRDVGGVAFVISSSVTIRDSKLLGNVAENGAGLFARAAAVALVGNDFRSNESSGEGGGLTLLDSEGTLRGNTIISNTAPWGGGLYLNDSPASLTGNTIVGNTATGRGGGGLFLNWSDALLTANRIVSNTSLNSGGGLYLWGSDPTVTNNLIARNDPDGVRVDGASPQLLHNTIAHNSGSGAGVHITEGQDRLGRLAISVAALTNNIVAGHRVGVTVTAGNTATLEATLWFDNDDAVGGDGAIVTGTVDIYGDPAFVAPEAGDYHIGPVSAAIDGGVGVGVTRDIDGEPRLGVPDLGADEYWAPGALRSIYLPVQLR